MKESSKVEGKKQMSSSRHGSKGLDVTAQFKSRKTFQQQKVFERAAKRPAQPPPYVDPSTTQEASVNAPSTAPDTSYNPTLTNKPSYNPTLTNKPSYNPTLTNKPSYNPTLTNKPSYNPTLTNKPSYNPTLTNKPSYKPAPCPPNRCGAQGSSLLENNNNVMPRRIYVNGTGLIRNQGAEAPVDGRDVASKLRRDNTVRMAPEPDDRCNTNASRVETTRPDTAETLTNNFKDGGNRGLTQRGRSNDRSLQLGKSSSFHYSSQGLRPRFPCVDGPTHAGSQQLYGTYMSEGVDTTVSRDFYADSKLPADKVRVFSNLNNQHQYFPANETHFSDYKPGNVNRSGSRMYQRCTSEESRRPLQLQHAVFRNKSTCTASRDAGTQISPSPSNHVGPRLTHTMSTCISTQCPSMHTVLPNYPLHRQSTEHVQSKQADDKTQVTEKRAPIENAGYTRSTVQPATQQAVSTISPSPAIPNPLAPYLDGQLDQAQLNLDARLLACVKKLYHNGYIRNRKDKEHISPAMAPPPFGYHIRRCSSSSQTTVAEVESWPQEKTNLSPLYKAQSALYANKNSLLDLDNFQMFHKYNENAYPLVEKQTSNEMIKKKNTKRNGDKNRAKQLMIIKKMNRMRSADLSYDTPKDKVLKRRSKREKKTHGCHDVCLNKCSSTDNEVHYDARKLSLHKHVRQRSVKCVKTKPGSKKKYILYYYQPLGRTEKGEEESNKKQTTDRLAMRTRNKNSNENKSDNTKGNETKLHSIEQKVCHTCLSYKIGMKRRRSSKLIRNVRTHLSASRHLNINTNAGTLDTDESKETADSASVSLCSNEKYFSTQDIKVIDDSQSMTAPCNEDTIDNVVQPSDGDGGHAAGGKSQNEGWEERKLNIMQACNEAIQSRLQRKDLEQIQSEECLESGNKETKLPSEIQPSPNVASAINHECSQMEGASTLSSQKEDPSTAAMKRKKKTKTTEALYIKFESSLSKKVTTTVVKDGRKPLTDKYKLEHNPLHGSGELVKTVASDFESDKRNLLENPRHTRIIRADKLDGADKKTKHKSETSLGYLASKGQLESGEDKDGSGVKTSESEHRFDAVKDLLSAACKEDDGYHLLHDTLPSSQETSTTISVCSPAQQVADGGSIEPQPTYQVTEQTMENLTTTVEGSCSLTSYKSKERGVRRPKDKSDTGVNKKTGKKKKAQKVKKHGEQDKVKDQPHTKTLLTISVTKKSPVRHYSPGAVKKRKVKDVEETSVASPPKKEKGKKKKTGEKKRKKTKSENDLVQLSGSNISMVANEKWQHSSSAPLENLQMPMKTDAIESPTEKSSSPKQERKGTKDEITLEIKSSIASEVSKMSGKSSLEAILTSSATSNDTQTKAEKAKLKKSEKELQKAELGWNSSLTAETKAADEKAKLIQRRNKVKYLIVKAKPNHDAEQTKLRRPACRNNPADAESVCSGSETEIKGEAASQREKAGQGKSVQFSESTENIESAKTTGGEGQSVDPAESIDEGEENNPNQESTEQSPDAEPANKPIRKPSGAMDKSDTTEEKVNVEQRSQSTPPRRKRPIWSKKTKEEQNRVTVDKTNTSTRPMEGKLKLRHSSDNIKKTSRSIVHLHYPLKTNGASPKTSSLNSKNTISYNQMLNGVFVSAPVNKSAKKMIAKVGSPVDIKEIIEGTSVDAAEYGPKPRGTQETGVRPAKSVPVVTLGKVHGTDSGKKGKIGAAGLKKNKVSKVRESGSVRSLASMESADDYIRGTGKSGHLEMQSSPTYSVSTDIDEVMKSKHGITSTRIGNHGHPRRKEKRPKKKSSSNHDVQWQPAGQVEPPRVHYYGDMMDLDVLNMGLSWMVQRFFNRLTVFQNNSAGSSDAGDMPSAQPVLE